MRFTMASETGDRASPQFTSLGNGNSSAACYSQGDGVTWNRSPELAVLPARRALDTAPRLTIDGLLTTYSAGVGKPRRDALQKISSDS